MTTTPVAVPTDATALTGPDALLAEIQALAAQVRRADRTIHDQVDAARSTELDGVTPMSRNAARVSSANLMKHGWSVKTYLPEVQVDGLLDAMRAGRKAEVRELVDWLDQDAQGLAKAGKTLPMEVHPTIARAVAAPLRAWLKLQDAVALNGPDDHAALTQAVTTAPPARRRRPGR